MLEKPELQDEKIVACLRADYGLVVVQVFFLPLGADQDTAVYRVVADNETPYFFKLRRGSFDETSVAVPKYLRDQGIAQVIAPLATKTGELWGNLDSFKTILYPFIDGCDGYEAALSDRQWVEFGAALKRIHSTVLPPALAKRIPRETFSSQWRESAKRSVGHVEDLAFDDPVAVKLAAFLKPRRDEILDLVGRTERLARAITMPPPEFTICHSDLHAGNILVGPDDDFYIVDWDNPILASKERDLMFIGGGQGFAGHTAQEEETLFYRGYGRTQIDPTALAYYRHERIIQDIAEFCEQIFSTNGGKQDREQSLRYLTSIFLPNGTLEIANKGG